MSWLGEVLGEDGADALNITEEEALRVLGAVAIGVGLGECNDDEQYVQIGAHISHAMLHIFTEKFGEDWPQRAMQEARKIILSTMPKPLQDAFLAGERDPWETEGDAWKRNDGDVFPREEWDA